jgi:BNR repeat-like domain
MATADALERRSRRRTRRRFLLEAVAVLGLTAGAIGAVYLFTVEKVASPWRVAATHIQNVSRAPGIQTEVAIAVDPTNARNLFAASNETLEPEIRVYTSTDAGETWSSRRGPLFSIDTCAWGDPSVAIGPNGRQYVAFTEKTICTRGPDLTPYLVVASRSGPTGKWVTRRLTRPAVKFGFDDKPALTVARDGRVYVVWSRLLRRAYQTTVLSSSADGGKTWSPPQPVSRELDQPQLVSLAAGPGRTLYIAGVDVRHGIWVGRSSDGGRRFAIKQAAPLPGNQAATCIVFGDYLIPQQAVRCLGPNPTVSVGKDRVFVTYATPGPNGTQDVEVAVFDSALRPVSRGRVGPADRKKSDQFWPVSATDARSGEVWACFYDSSGDHERKHAWFACTVSRDGRRWSTPVRAAPDSANAGVLWEDARIYGFGDSGGYGGYPGLAVKNGIAHPLWIDTRGTGGDAEEIYGSRLTVQAARADR